MPGSETSLHNLGLLMRKGNNEVLLPGMLPKLPKNLTFVDLETTGTSPAFDRVIEIGIIRVENNKVVQEYNQLINPEKPVSPFILQMTGIPPDQLENAPTFYRVRKDVFELLENSIFVAHNVRFDYGFIRQEFLRFGIKLTLPHFCTVRLFRALVPGRKRYNLDELIAHFGISCTNRHRAFDDAKVLWDFYQIGKKEIPRSKFSKAIAYASKRPSLPSQLAPETIDRLPESPGVYIFRDTSAVPLYIGKSTNIKERVLSHFSSDYKSGIEMKMKGQITHIETIPTSGELGALLLESELIKSQQPVYNRMLKIRRRMIIEEEVMTQNNYLTVTWETVETIDPTTIPSLLGVYKSEKQLKETLFILAKEHMLCPKLLGLEKGKGPCFAFHLHQCNGACMEKEIPARYNLRFREAFLKLKFKRWPFPHPIIIRENNSTGGEGFIINHWCLVGKASWDDTGALHTETYEYVFDVDVYKILVRYIFNQHHMRNISPLSQQNELQKRSGKKTKNLVPFPTPTYL